VASVQDLLNRARIPLNDDAKGRWPDPELLAYLNEGLALVRKSRPDLFLGKLLDEIIVEIGDADPIVPYTHHQSLVDYVTARAQMKDGDQSGTKAAELLQLSIAGIR
jgi:hypothetical protein